MTARQYTGRRMKFNAATSIPRYLISLATATVRQQDPTEPHRFIETLRCGVAMSCRLEHMQPTRQKVLEFTTGREFWDWTYQQTKSNYTTWIVSTEALTNLVSVGMAVEFDESRITLDAPRGRRNRDNNDPDHPHNYGLCVIESPPTIIGMRATQSMGRIVVVDTLNWFNCSISDLAHSLSVPHRREPTNSASDEEYLEYCHHRCMVSYGTFLALIRWHTENNLGQFAYTAAGQAMHAYRHRFMSQRIYIHDNVMVKAIERAGYFGGRTEVFKHGKITCDVWQLDVNSLFPSVMASNLFPRKLVEYDLNDLWHWRDNDLPWERCIVECEVNTDKPLYPYRTEKRIVYPVGAFQTVLCGPELKMAADHGHLMAIKSWAIYELESLFESFVSVLWSMRVGYQRDGNRLYEQFVKSLLNSLYGKMGQMTQEWLPCHSRADFLPWSTWTELDAKAMEWRLFHSFGWHAFKQVGRKERPDTLVAIPAFVTSYARCRMNYLRHIAGPTEVFYQGVDSLVVTSKGKERLENAEEIRKEQLGSLRPVLFADNGYVYGSADYRLGNKTVIAGRYNAAVEIEDGLYATRRAATAAALFNGEPLTNAINYDSSWQRKGAYAKGTIGYDGWVAPLIMSDTSGGGRSRSSASRTISAANASTDAG